MVAVVAVAVGALATAGTATAWSATGEKAAPAVDQGPKLGFYETYRGHQIMGWGSGDTACAYIDGKRLVVYPGDSGQYTSAVQGFQPERSLRAITRASVKTLGDNALSADAEPAAHCPQFEIRTPVATPSATK
ncbi:hypothetical protein Ait01nite_033870 [Actinoplanes italicus]|uniref:Tyrosinase co-factor MelC1 n=1 Tax=Actinoplanes italicus TaxID=113567 RepID=A0A2T0K410_9ACTN|nr:tyrosinase co-factor MelC1 [Actinoplanes italicus]GIE30342.1 hypothetical protein Ait01nite_033870 [Actinoplanes italicus]